MSHCLSSCGWCPLRSWLLWYSALVGFVAIVLGSVGCGPGWSLPQLGPRPVVPVQSSQSDLLEIDRAAAHPEPVPSTTAQPLVQSSNNSSETAALDWAARRQTAAALQTTRLQTANLRAIDQTEASPVSGSIASPAPLRADRNATAQNADPDLGVLRLRLPGPGDTAQTIADPDLGVIRVRPPSSGDAAPSAPPPVNCDPDLGCLRLRQPLPPIATSVRRNPVVFLLARVDYFRSSNVFSSEPPQPDSLTRPGVTLYAAPTIGPNTYFVASATGNLLRYAEQPRVDSNELFFRAGIVQRLSPTMFGEIGWSNQQLFISGDRIQGLPTGTRYLNDHAIRVELNRRDRLSDRVSLSSFYQFRYSFADPIDRSRQTHALSLSLNYDIRPNWQLGLDYQLALANFTQQHRQDLYNQILGRLSYTVVRDTQVNVFLGYSFGRSSDQTINFNGLLFGVSLSATLGLF